MSESSEQYSIDVVVTGTIVRTISTVSPSTTYSAADQTTDGITPGNPITVRVYQVSSRVGRGRKAEATI